VPERSGGLRCAEAERGLPESEAV